jgi:hypothetical protein
MEPKLHTAPIYASNMAEFVFHFHRFTDRSSPVERSSMHGSARKTNHASTSFGSAMD